MGGYAGLRVGPVVDGLDVQFSGGAVQRRIDDGEQAAARVGHGHPLAVDLAGELVVGVAGDHQVHCPVQTGGDLGDGSVESVSAVALATVGEPALVEQHDNCLDSVGAERGDQRVYGLGLVAEGDALHSEAGHDARRALQRHPDEGYLYAIVLTDGVGREDGAARFVVDDVGGKELELCAGEGIAVQVAVDRMRTALLHSPQLGGTLVKLVVAHAVEVEAHQVHGLDGRLVVEQGGNEGRRSDEVAGGYEDRVLRLGPGGRDVGGQVVGATHAAE